MRLLPPAIPARLGSWGLNPQGWPQAQAQLSGRGRGEPAAHGVSPQDYELQLITYKAQLEPVASPAKKPKVQSGSESVIQEVRRRAWPGGGWRGPVAGGVAGWLGGADPGCPSSSPQYVDLRTRYSELTMLTSQYIKFLSETLRRMEEEEVGLGLGLLLPRRSPGSSGVIT